MASGKLSGIDDINWETIGSLTLSYFENNDFAPLLCGRSSSNVVVFVGGRAGGSVEEFINIVSDSNTYINK